jgi:hypothetical protein
MKHSLFTTLAAILLVSSVGCSSKKKEKLNKSETAGSAAVTVPSQVSESPHYASIAFDKGETRLSAMDKRSLQDLAHKVRQSGKDIDDIKILTWADKEYGPGRVPAEASNSDIILARQRAESIKRYIQEDLMEDEDIDFYNMAQKPGPLSRFFKTDEATVKQAFQQNKDDNMLSESLASKALVIIEYENQQSTNL